MIPALRHTGPVVLVLLLLVATTCLLRAATMLVDDGRAPLRHLARQAPVVTQPVETARVSTPAVRR